jgi:hypothetical protein
MDACLSRRQMVQGLMIEGLHSPVVKRVPITRIAIAPQ